MLSWKTAIKEANKVKTIILSRNLQILINSKKKEHMVKLQRAQGECLGTRSRRRTQQTAISYGEP